MQKILLTHFYNEEYLLPFWLNHHKKIFDHCIMFDYQSTDSSVDIIKKICPEWEIIPSRNKEFAAEEIDIEILEAESRYGDGIYRMCLSITEFLVCKPDFFKIKQKNQYLIPAFTMVDNLENKNTELINDISLIKQRTHGLHYKTNFASRRARSMHNFNIKNYPLGRHYGSYNTNDAVLCWYGYSPFNDTAKRRKYDIGKRIPERDIKRGWALHHKFDEKKLEEVYSQLLKDSQELEQEIKNIMGDYYDNL
jgi:hypothetical protein